MKYLVFFLLFLLINNCFAQQINGDAKSLSETITNSLFKTFKPNRDSVNNVCERGIVFALFQIHKGQITDVTFSGAKRPFIKIALQNALDSINVNPANMLKLINVEKVFLLPLVYDFQNGCKFPKFVVGKSDDTFYKQYLDVWMERDVLMPSIMNMLNFKQIKHLDKEVTLLPPFTIGNMGH